MTLLLLAGSGEAQQIAQALADQELQTIASLAGVTRTPKEMAVPVRVGGFGGDEGFRDYLTKENITAVLDATHPFAARISNRSARICAEQDIPYCQVLRPGWVPKTGDHWVMIDAEEQAADYIAPGSKIFLATGRQTLGKFNNLLNCKLICRQIDPPDRPFPFPNGEFLVGRPPFSVAEERALFARLQIDWLVVKNAGGKASATKLTAARELGIKVAMINRPLAPDTPKVETVQAALAWVAGL